MIKTFHYKLVEVRTSATAYIIAVQLLSRKIKINKKFLSLHKKAEFFNINICNR